MKRVCLILLMCAIGAAAQADLVTQPYVTGDFNGWDPGAAIMMTDLGGGLWEYTISRLDPDQYQQFKITPGRPGYWGCSLRRKQLVQRRCFR